jgi:hypothetical protein
MLEDDYDFELDREIGGTSWVCCDDGCADGRCVHGSSLVCWSVSDSVRRFCAGMMQVMLDPSVLRVGVGDR